MAKTPSVVSTRVRSANPLGNLGPENQEKRRIAMLWWNFYLRAKNGRLKKIRKGKLTLKKL